MRYPDFTFERIRILGTVILSDLLGIDIGI
jgi:hypothetical protein